jgi:8-hydroxy-5-deazaflavin:NADPH oxidoreductase
VQTPFPRPRVGIIGSGAVARSLGTGFAALGYPVMLGSRRPEKLAEWLATACGDISAGTDEAAAAFGDIVVFAVRWSGAEEAAKLVGADNLADKIVIDTTNPLIHYEAAPPALALGWNDSAGEQVQGWFPKARVVKCFNIVGAKHMVDPDFPGGPPTMFFCGNDRDAKHEVEEILREFGWEWVDLGGIVQSRLIEPLAMIWIDVARAQGPDHAFKLLRR